MEKQKEDKAKLIYAAAAVRKVINEMEPGTLFHGHELKAKCVKLYP